MTKETQMTLNQNEQNYEEGEVRSLGFAIKHNGYFLAERARHRGCAAGCSRVMTEERGRAMLFSSRVEAEAVRDAEGLNSNHGYDGVRVVELFEEVR